MSLTRSQQKVFDYLCHFIEKEGFPPAYSDIAKHFNFTSDGTVRTYLEYLEKKGYIKRLGKARGIKILKRAYNEIPIVGSISAGPIKLAVEDEIGVVSDLELLKKKEGRFALKIKGDSMINAGIFDGDVAVIQKSSQINNGQIAAILIEHEATLKRVYFEKEKVRLQPENDHYPPIYFDMSELEAFLLGTYVGLVREV